MGENNKIIQELKEYKKIINEASIVSKANLNGYITYVNDKFCEISGYSREELINKNHNIVRSQNMSKENFEDLWATIKNKKTWHGIIENRAKDGHAYFVKATIIPILDENNEIIEYISLREDISELKQRQLNELNSSVAEALDIRWEQMVEFIPAPTAIVTQDSLIQYSNNLFKK